MEKGCKLTANGFICLSKKKKNQVISNVIGASAYHGRVKILKNLVNKHKQLDINHLAQEK